MEYKKINNIKLKVILDEEECKTYKINPTSEWWDKRNMKSFFEKMLETAKVKLQFNLTDDRVIIQVFPRDSGGAEIYVTTFNPLVEKDRKSLQQGENIYTMKRHETVFRFSNFTDIKNAFRNIKNKNLECDIYKSEIGEYFSVIRDYREGSITSFDILFEYGEKIPTLPDFLYGERGECLTVFDGIDYILNLQNERK